MRRPAPPEGRRRDHPGGEHDHRHVRGGLQKTADSLHARTVRQAHVKQGHIEFTLRYLREPLSQRFGASHLIDAWRRILQLEMHERNVGGIVVDDKNLADVRGRHRSLM